MLKTKVKVGSINNLSDARYCAGMGVELLGFSIGGSQDNIDPKKYAEITSWVSGPKFVLEWSADNIPGDFAAILASYNASIVQIDVQLLRNIPSLPLEWIVSLHPDSWLHHRQELAAKKDQICFLLLDVPASASHRALISEIATEFPVLLSGVDAANIDVAIELPVAGISLQGSNESKPGIMDYQHLEEILERLTIEI